MASDDADGSTPSASQTTDSQTPTQTQPRRVRARPASYYGLPHVVIYNDQPGPRSGRVDERCFTYCSQTSIGRSANQPPKCRSVCIRRVFEHELNNIMNLPVSYDSSRKPMIPLPKHLQDKDSHQPQRFYQEGYYFWTTTDFWSHQEKMEMMKFTLSQQMKYEMRKLERTVAYEEYKKRMRDVQVRPSSNNASVSAGPSEDSGSGSHHGADMPSSSTPPMPPPSPPSQSEAFMVHLPTSFTPIYQQVQNALQPSRKLMGLVHESIVSGAQKELMFKIWDKAWTHEPILLAQKVIGRVVQVWKAGPPEDTDTK